MGRASKGPLASQRAYPRLTLDDRRGIERGLDRRGSLAEIGRRLGRPTSTVSREVARNRVFSHPRSSSGERWPAEAPEGACDRLSRSPGVCNGCRLRRHGCRARARAEYRAVRAQALADEELSAARRGIDETEQGAARKMEIVRSDLARGLSPAQIAATRPSLGLSRSTIYRWCDEGYGGMSNMELRRKVGYKPRRRRGPGAAPARSDRRSHATFEALPADARDAAREMDTVLGSKRDSARLLTLLHRPTGFQPALPLRDGSDASVADALLSVREAVGGAEAMRRVFGAVLTDNGPEFADDRAIASALCEAPGETRLFYCDPRRADQKGA